MSIKRGKNSWYHVLFFDKTVKKNCLNLISSSAMIVSCPPYKQQLQFLYPGQELAQEAGVVLFRFCSFCLFTAKFKIILAWESIALELLWKFLDFVSFLG